MQSGTVSTTSSSGVDQQLADARPEHQRRDGRPSRSATATQTMKPSGSSASSGDQQPRRPSDGRWRRQRRRASAAACAAAAGLRAGARHLGWPGQASRPVGSKSHRARKCAIGRDDVALKQAGCGHQLGDLLASSLAGSTLRRLQLGQRHQLADWMRRRRRRRIRRKCRSRRMSWPPLPVIHFRKACASVWCLLEASTPPPEIADEGARILVLEVVQRDVLAVLAGLGLIAEVVVVIDHARLRSRRR